MTEAMEHSTTGLRRRSVPSSRKSPLPQSPSPTFLIANEGPPPTTPRRRRSSGFRHFEMSRTSRIAQFFYRGLLSLLSAFFWVLGTVGIVLLVLFLVALFNALPIEMRAKTLKNFFRSVTDWRIRDEEENWWMEKGMEMVTGLFLFERALLECLSGQWERCRVV